MATITINGVQVEFEGKPTILQVAQDNGLAIPHYCYHRALSIVGSCRLCLGEVAQPNPRQGNQLEWIPKLVPTCQTTAVDGMVVNTKSPKSIANQKAVMEFLLINHPLDCPVCDQAGECELQDYSYQYGRAESRMRDDKIKQPKKDLGQHVYLYADRCIMCTRCVRFTREITGTSELAVIGRGNREQIDLFPGRALDNELSGNVVDICPVGAMLDKDFLFSQRVWFLSKTPSIDGLTASGDNITLEHNSARIYRLKPRLNMAVNRWWTSDEIRYGWKFIHDEKRLTTPMRQQPGGQIPCAWARAYEEVVTGFRSLVTEHGPGSLAVMVSPMLACEEAYLLAKFILSLDPQATLAVGPVPVKGADKSFPGGYTIRAEKCPNSRGVRRALELAAAGAQSIMDYAAFTQALADKQSKTKGLLLTGGYPEDWVQKDLTSAVGSRFTVLIDILPRSIAGKVNLLLPGATWAEKAGSFENAGARIQGFEKAVNPPGEAKPEGQIALDLLAQADATPPQRYDPATIRTEMALTVAEPPKRPAARLPAMHYVEL